MGYIIYHVLSKLHLVVTETKAKEDCGNLNLCLKIEGAVHATLVE